MVYLFRKCEGEGSSLSSFCGPLEIDDGLRTKGVTVSTTVHDSKNSSVGNHFDNLTLLFLATHVLLPLLYCAVEGCDHGDLSLPVTLMR